MEEITGAVAEIHAVVKNGNTYYYFRLTGSETVYIASVELSDALPFIKAGDTVRFTVQPGDTAVLGIL